MLLADRPTTSRWTPHRANAPIRSGRSSKARTEADTSSARHPRRSQSHSESDLGSPSTLREPSPTPGNQIQHRDRIRVSRPRRSGHCAGDVPMLDVPWPGLLFSTRRSPTCMSRPSSGQWVGGGFGSSRGAAAVPTSPSAGLLPIRRRPSRPSSDRESRLSRVGIARSNIISPSGNSPARATCWPAASVSQLVARRAGRVRPVAACSAAQRSTSGLSQTLTRPLPKLRTGRGMSRYRCW